MHLPIELKLGTNTGTYLYQLWLESDVINFSHKKGQGSVTPTG